MSIERDQASVRSSSASARSTRSSAVGALSRPTNTAMGDALGSSCITVLIDSSGRGFPSSAVASDVGTSTTGSGRT